MALSKQDRIETSKKLTGIEQEVAQADGLIALAAESELAAQAKDSPNKAIIEDENAKILPYQQELLYLEGNERTVLTESIMVDSVNRALNNSFFPNDPDTALPSLPDGVWTFLNSFAYTHAIGKDAFEDYVSTGNRTEQDIIDEINAKIVLIEAEPVPRLATGQKCESSGTCSDPLYTDQATCELNGETWTPGADVFSEDTVVTGLLADLKTLVQEWEDIMGSQNAVIPTNDENATRQSGNDSAIADIANAVSIIDTWQAVQDFDTTTVLPATCAEFDAMVEGDFEQAKLLSTTLSQLKAELTARASFINARETALLGGDYLGTITQDLGTGTVSAYTGLYGKRYLFIELRINSISGTLSEVIALQNSSSSYSQAKDSAEMANVALNLIMTATPAIAPGLDIKFLSVKDVSGFSVGDRVYVVADDQEELSGSIESIDGNRVGLTFKVPKKYTLSNLTRMYKVL